MARIHWEGMDLGYLCKIWFLIIQQEDTRKQVEEQLLEMKGSLARGFLFSFGQLRKLTLESVYKDNPMLGVLRSPEKRQK